MGILDNRDEEDSLLITAINANNEELVLEIFARYRRERKRQYTYEKSEQCLLFSVETGNIHMTRFLVRKLHVSVNCETKDINKSRPIHLAVMNKSLDMAKEIIMSGSSLNAKNGMGKYPLNLAVECNDLDMVKLLVKHGSFTSRLMDWMSQEDVEQPMHTAIRLDNWDIFEYFMSKRTNLNCMDSKGNTCVHYAVKHSQYHILETLCEKGADLTIGCPLLTALQMRSFRMANLLLKHKAGVKTHNRDAVVCHVPIVYHKDRDKQSEEHQYVYHEIVRRSHDYLNETDLSSGFAPLHYAAQLNSKEIAQLLLDYGADIDVESRQEKRTPLWLSVSPGSSPDMALFLLEHGANVKMSHHSGNLLNQLVLSANIVFFSPPHVELLKTLITKGVRINSVDERQFTPLERYILLSSVSFWTSASNATLRNKEVIAELVSAGARIQLLSSTQNPSGIGQHLSPLCRVTWYGDFDTSRFLIDSGVNIKNEKWIHFHGNKPEVEAFMCELREVAKSPSRLMVLCRTVIRDRLSQCNGDLDIRPDIEDLDLPGALEKFLKLDQELTLYLDK